MLIAISILKVLLSPAAKIVMWLHQHQPNIFTTELSYNGDSFSVSQNSLSCNLGTKSQQTVSQSLGRNILHLHFTYDKHGLS